MSRFPGSVWLAAIALAAAATFSWADDATPAPAKLVEDGRIGKVIDWQGIVSVRSAMADRFTPVAGPVLLEPGDWLRTDPRGANAVAARIGQELLVTLGPGAVLELRSPGELRLSAGEIQLAGVTKPVTLCGPDREPIDVKETAIFRIKDGKLVRVTTKPQWLRGFEGTIASESIGSLVAKVDGRNVPLTVGYHKVTVDIRDQIARTVIEESFVNHTHGRLEGVFSFPLPQDASISGFGMWIDGELVEADVVEKQRAREIFETILREKRDPGLLEWSGGNVFKARVFPIEAHSEKRITITYTQVLPARGRTYRYEYPLRSELLQQHPLRELAIDVRVHSVLPLAGIRCPTHLARIAHTPHSAHVGFTAQEYRPDRDFEVVVDLGVNQPEIVAIPHRRGDDGSFMLMLNLPGDEGAWNRDMLPTDEPLDLMILADTSGSIDASGRRAQAELIGAMLASLTPKDRFNLAVCDVEYNPVFDAPVAADEKHITRAREFLERRVSLGWTDLERAVSSVLEQCGPKTQVVYVGDGIPASTETDPVAVAARIRRLYEASGSSATFHAIAVGSRFESGVLKTLASLGGGSMRHVGAEHGPAMIARDLLSDMMRPTLHDLTVDFRGLRTASVYPEDLPNLAPGTQQIVLGRYLPEGQDQRGEVIVSGTMEGRPVRYSTAITLAHAEEGNSFIPRLWARQHLDELLAQGPSLPVRDDIIALSEQFHIITPYTSLLILETDEDRARFGVTRGFQMRDGEKFFAEGRDAATHDLARQQMLRAGTWRAGLRTMVLAEISRLGRSTSITIDESGKPSYEDERHRVGGCGGGVGGGGGGQQFHNVDLAQQEAAATTEDEDAMPGDDIAAPQAVDEQRGWLAAAEEAEIQRGQAPRNPFGGHGGGQAESLSLSSSGWEGSSATSNLALGWDAAVADASQVGGRFARYSYALTQLDELLPSLPAPPDETTPSDEDNQWPAEVRELAHSLLRSDMVVAKDVGLAINLHADEFDPATGTSTSRIEQAVVLSPHGWVVRESRGTPSNVHQEPLQWCYDKQRGVSGDIFQLGRVRPAQPSDLREPPLGLAGPQWVPLDHDYGSYEVKLEPQAGDRVLMVLTHPTAGDHQVRILIDMARRVVLEMEKRYEGHPGDKTTFREFTEIHGAWLATQIEETDNAGQRVSLVTLEFDALTADAATRRIQEALASQASVLTLAEPLPTFAEAKQAVVEGRADVNDQLALVVHWADVEKWPQVFEHLAAAEKLAVGKPGMRFVRDAILVVARRHEALRVRLLTEAADLAKPHQKGLPPTDQLRLADHLIEQASETMEANEKLALLDLLRPVYEAAPENAEAIKRWMAYRVRALEEAGRPQEALVLQKELAERYPKESRLQVQYAEACFQADDSEAGYAWLHAALASGIDWPAPNEAWLRAAIANRLASEGRYPELVTFCQAWIARCPGAREAYRNLLSGLVHSGREMEADRLVASWLEDAREADGPLTAEQDMRVGWAVDHALRGENGVFGDTTAHLRWQDPLAATVLALGEREVTGEAANRIMNDYRFQRLDAWQTVARVAIKRLHDGAATLPVDELVRYVSWLVDTKAASDADSWRAMVDTLRRRARDEEDGVRRQTLVQAIDQIIEHRFPRKEYFDSLRSKIAKGNPGEAGFAAWTLFHALLADPWTQDHEDEAFDLIDRMAEGPSMWETMNEDAGRLISRVQDLHTLTDAMVEARFNAGMAAIAHPLRLSRTDLRDEQARARRQARAGFADRLRREEENHEGPFRNWLAIERLTLEARLGREPERVATECLEILGARPPRLMPEPTRTAAEQLDVMLTGRALMTLFYLASRPGADPKIAEQVIAFVDAGMAAEPRTDAWRQIKYQLLVALDRPQELAASLRSWIEPEHAVNHWRVVLGYVLAEQGTLDQAIAQFEAIREAGELGPGEYRALADWYTAVDRRADSERAMMDAFMAASENELGELLSRHAQTWHEGESRMPGELSPDVPRIVEALFKKSEHPEKYSSDIHEIYRESRDFRLLRATADALLGHSASSIYPVLGAMNSIVAGIREEATVDEIVAYLDGVRRRVKTDVDCRSLDLLEVIVECRAAELRKDASPHGERALAALRRGRSHEWTPGEPRLAADLLASLGRIAFQPLADEQIKALKGLSQLGDRGSEDRLRIASCLARTEAAYERVGEAIAVLEAAIAERAEANQDTLPASANDVLATLLDHLEKAGRYRHCEAVLLDQCEHPATAAQSRWLTARLDQLYERAIRQGATVSLGSGQGLYEAVEQRLRAAMRSTQPRHRQRLVENLLLVYRAANDKEFADMADDLREFAFMQLPDLAVGEAQQSKAVVERVANALHDLIDARTAIEFLIVQIESERVRPRAQSSQGVSQLIDRLASWRKEAPDLGNLEPRLPRVFLAGLHRNLEEGKSVWGPYSKGSAYFWSEKSGEFAREAEAVLAEHLDSSPTVEGVAVYLSSGLGLHERAIEILFAADRRGVLGESGKTKLVAYLQERDRYAESIPILRPLVEAHPDVLANRINLMRAYFRTGELEKLRETLRSAHDHFHTNGRWGEATMMELADGCADVRLFDDAVDYFREAIAEHQHSAPKRGIGDGTLSWYYESLARTLSEMGRTSDAVDAACAALVSWGKDHDRRNEALDVLEGVLENAPDLDAFVAELDREATRSGQESPIVRKAVGQIYSSREEYAKAIVQLAIAVAVEPGDRDTREALIECYELDEKPRAAIGQLLELREQAPRDIELCRSLGHAYSNLEMPRESERAMTTIVEAMPREAESHALLAEVREQQDRWDEAVRHWQQAVALGERDPRGLLGLAGAFISLHRWDEATETLQLLDATDWPESSGDVEHKVSELWQQFEDGRPPKP